MGKTWAALACALLTMPPVAAADRIALTVDASEADAVLAIVSKNAKGETVAEADWNRLFASEPYVRLKKREAQMKRAFTDEDFRAFVLAPERARDAAALAATLAAWRKVDLRSEAARVMAYLPADATIRAKVYPVIKPKTNSFVFEVSTDPAIFLFLDPKVPPAKFANTVAHELHHIGFASIEARLERALAGLEPGPKKALEWTGAFGEGFAMLAAAGSPDVHPHAVSEPEERARWDRDMTRADEDLRSVERFLADVADGKLKTEDEIRERGFSFFGEQGAWYTVGYRMAAAIERAEGRAVLIDCMADPRKLLLAWNRVAPKGAALFSAELLGKLGLTTSSPASATP